jgi:hypothetical protein
MRENDSSGGVLYHNNTNGTCDALKAAQEFAISATVPKSIRWNSLVDGE